MELEELRDVLWDIKERTVRIETKVEAVVGNGQPGALAHIDDRLRSVEKFKEQSVGRHSAMALIASAVSMVGAELLHLFVWKK